MTNPLISCLMITGGRRNLVPIALESFARQTYEPRELIVVDEVWRGGCGDLVRKFDGDNPRFEKAALVYHYVAVHTAVTMGAKWNIAAEVSRGQLMTLWADDDWQDPDRLATQAALLIDDSDHMRGWTALESVFYLNALTMDVWQYAHGRGLDGTALFPRAFYESRQFPRSDRGAGAFFLDGRGRPTIHVDAGLYWGVYHGRNTWRGFFDGPGWQQRPDVEPPRRLVELLRNGGVVP